MKAWAIDTREPDGRLIGIGWFGWPAISQVHLGTLTTALFRTRKVAAASLVNSRVKGSYPRARVVRVAVTVTPLTETKGTP